MSVELAALETIYAVLEHPMADDHRGIRTPSGPRNAANDAIAKKIVEALQKSNLLRETFGREDSQDEYIPNRSDPERVH
jgi:hypothetical protein